jgi:hypothetical protein
MKKYVQELQLYFKETFSWKLYGSIALFTFILISLNYYFNVEDSLNNDSSLGLILSLILSVAYLGTCLIIELTTSKKGLFKSKGFWLSFLFFIFFYTLYRCSNFNLYFSKDYINNDEFIYFFRLYGNLEDILWGLIPFVLFYWIYDKKNIDHCYGIRTKGVNFTPYFIMLGIMAVPIFFAAQTDDFLESYPKAMKAHYAEYASFNSISNFRSLMQFELFYLISFIAVEMMFRGYLIYRMEKYLGNYVVLPMMVAYAALHFGKPLGETMGSIGGAYI